MQLVTVRRIRGLNLIVLVRTPDGEHLLVSTAVSLWRPGKRKETGGMVPKPYRRKRRRAKVLRLSLKQPDGGPPKLIDLRILPDEEA
ncbi:MAG: hypothetical protein WCA59_09715 [Candidatus Binataceae bacterium]